MYVQTSGRAIDNPKSFIIFPFLPFHGRSSFTHTVRIVPTIIKLNRKGMRSSYYDMFVRLLEFDCLQMH